MAEPRDTYEQGLDQVLYQVYDRVGRALQDVAVDVASQGSDRAPIDTGILSGSITAEAGYKLDEMLGRLSTTVVAATPYALIQHEHEEFNHPRGGEAKYLSRPFQERLPRYQAALQETLVEALRAAGRAAL